MAVRLLLPALALRAALSRAVGASDEPTQPQTTTTTTTRAPRQRSLRAPQMAQAADDLGIAYLGSAGCDPDAPGCDPGAVVPGEERIYAVEVHADGALVPRPDLTASVGSRALWLTLAREAGQTCLFASLESQKIVGLAAGPEGQLGSPGEGASAGGLPVHTVATSAGGFLLSANYYGAGFADAGSVSSLRIGAGCGVARSDLVELPHGSGVVAWGQSVGRAHGVVASGEVYYVCDWGADQVKVYGVEPSSGALGSRSSAETPGGCAPRHAVKHPSAPFLYVVCELNHMLLTFSVAEGSGALTLVQQTTVAAGGKLAELAVLPSGAALYVSSRNTGQDTVTAYAIGGADGQLRQLQTVPVPAFPRGMTLAMGGRLLLVAGQQDTELVSFSVGPTGELTSTGQRLRENLPPHPAAIAML